MGGRVRIVPSSEVPIVAGDDGVGLPFLDILSVPLSNARSTGVGQDHSSNILQGFVLGREGGREGGCINILIPIGSGCRVNPPPHLSPW